MYNGTVVYFVNQVMKIEDIILMYFIRLGKFGSHYRRNSVMSGFIMLLVINV